MEEMEVDDKMSSTCWRDLDEDCLLIIFQKLALDDLVLGVPFVCYSWFKISLNPHLWKSSLDLRFWDTSESRLISLNSKAKMSFSKFLRFLVSRSSVSVISLHFPATGVSISDLIFISRKCPNLEFLMFSFPQEAICGYCDRLRGVVGRWRKLEYVCFTEAPANFPEIMEEIGRCCENFQGLKVSGSALISITQHIVTHIPKIKALDLSWSFVSDDDLKLILEGCNDLEELDLSNCVGFELDNEMVARFKQSVKSFKHERFQWGCFSYIDDKWAHTDMELGHRLG